MHGEEGRGDGYVEGWGGGGGWRGGPEQRKVLRVFNENHYDV